MMILIGFVGFQHHQILTMVMKNLNTETKLSAWVISGLHILLQIKN